MPIPLQWCSSPRTNRPQVLLAGLGLLIFLAAACSPAISTFNATAYDQATSLKVEALALMEEATNPYADHAEAVNRLKMDLQKAYEFAQGRPNNEISARQWELLISPDRDLLGGFLRDWKASSSFSAPFVAEKKKQIAAAFDTIIELESGKMDPEDVQGGS